MLILTVAPVSIHATRIKTSFLLGVGVRNLPRVHDLEITSLRKLNLLYCGCSLWAIATDPAWTNDQPSGIACSSSKQDISQSGPGMPRDERYAAATFFKAALYFLVQPWMLRNRAIRWRLACKEFRFPLVSLVESELLRHRTSCTLNYFCNFLWMRDIDRVARARDLDLVTVGSRGIPAFEFGVDGSV